MMEKKVTDAMNDIALIRTVIERTQQDFSKLSGFFLGIGAVNLVKWIMEQAAYAARNLFGYGNKLTGILDGVSRIFLWVSYIVLFFIYYRRNQKAENEISQGMVKIWGIVLLSSELFSYLYLCLIPAGNNGVLNTMVRLRELIIVLPVVFALFMTGIFIKRNWIILVTALYSLVYFFLLVSMKEIPYGTWGGVGTRIPVSSVWIKVLMIAGMGALGIYLRKGVKADGNKFDTGSVSDEA